MVHPFLTLLFLTVHFLTSPEVTPVNIPGGNDGTVLISSPESDNSGIITFPDLYFECHIAEISRTTSIHLFYNESVRHYINLYFTERVDQISTINDRSEVYFPVF